MPPRKLPSDEVLRRWREDENLTYKQIHQRLQERGINVGLSAVGVALSRLGATDRIRYDDWLPWPRIAIEHNQAWEATMLRAGARLARNLPVDANTEKLFTQWMAELEDKGAVVAYREDRGFFYTAPREGIDGVDGIPVRRP